MAQHDFDFFYGDWNVRNRRLRTLLTGSDDWYQFAVTSSARPLWGGLANADDFIAEDTPGGPIRGMTVRLFDTANGVWRIIGSFEAGVGRFYGHEVVAGRAVFVRYTWEPNDATTCRWSQAFSVDAGASWETNWIMDFTRKTAP